MTCGGAVATMCAMFSMPAMTAVFAVAGVAAVMTFVLCFVTVAVGAVFTLALAVGFVVAMSRVVVVGCRFLWGAVTAMGAVLVLGLLRCGLGRGRWSRLMAGVRVGCGLRVRGDRVRGEGCRKKQRNESSGQAVLQYPHGVRRF